MLRLLLFSLLLLPALAFAGPSANPDLLAVLEAGESAYRTPPTSLGTHYGALVNMASDTSSTYSGSPIAITGQAYYGSSASSTGSWVALRGEMGIANGSIGGLTSGLFTGSLTGGSTTTLRTNHSSWLLTGGTATELIAYDFSTLSTGTVNATDFFGLRLRPGTLGSGTFNLSRYAGLKLEEWNTTPTLTDNYGLLIEELTKGTNNYAVWLDGANKIHFREATTDIYSPSTGVLRLDAATNININGAYTLPVADGSAGTCLKTDGAGAVTFGACGSGGTPGGSSTQIQYNNAGSFGGISTFTTDGTDLALAGGDFTFGTNDKSVYSTTSEIYSDGTDLVIDAISGQVDIGKDGTDPMRVERIGLGGTATSSLFWINFVQTTSTGRGALNFDYTYTGTGPTLNILSAMRYQGSSALGLNSRFISEDGSATVISRDLGLEHLFDITATYDNAGITRNFYGIRVDDEDAGYGAAHTAGTVNRWGLLCETLHAISGVTTDFTACVDAATDILIHDDVRLYLEGSRASKGDTYITYDSAGTEIDVVVNGFTALSIDGTDPTDYSVSNLTTDRAYDADATSTAELADVLGTLIQDLRDRIGLQW